MSRIQFNRFKLRNGLTVLHHYNKNTPFVVVGLLYKTGSINEKPGYTGLAHLLEHLMFTGSVNVKSFDEIISRAGGENNAFTSNDITYYYICLPYQNIEVALFAESDRMQNLLLKEKSIDIQKKVVIEEFKQRYINRPYGDVEQIIRSNLYGKHPYHWPTIGESIEDIKRINKKEIKEFYDLWYSPVNCILSICGNIEFNKVKSLVEKYFENIINTIPISIEQNNKNISLNSNILEVKRKVPQPAIYISFLTSVRNSYDYYCLNIIASLLSDGKSSILYDNLIKKKNIFSEIDCYLSDNFEKGFMIIGGKFFENYKPDYVLNKLRNCVNKLKNVSKFDIEKVKNKYELYYQTELLDNCNVAEMLAYYEYLGNADLINNEINLYRKISKKDIIECYDKYFGSEKQFVLYYLPESL